MPEAKNIRGRFFAIDRRICERVYDLGMNAAVAYLVLACGTDRNNSLTEWSIHAIEKYTGISRARAGAAVEKLVSGDIIRRVISRDDRPITKFSHPKKSRPEKMWLFGCRMRW